MRLSSRERQLMENIDRRGQATARKVMDERVNPPRYSAVHAKLRIPVDKGFLKHECSGPRYLYKPVVKHEKAQNIAKNVLHQFQIDDSQSGLNMIRTLEM